MKVHSILSDQLYTWSDRNNAERAHRHIAKTPQHSSAPTAPAQSDPPRLPHRALQTMWQTGMQMRRRSWSWAQVLSVGELPGLASENGLRAAGGLRSDGRVPHQLPPSPRDLGEDLRDQQRTAATPGGTLRGHHEECTFCSGRTDRCGFGRCAPRQYARPLARRQPRFVHCGDSR